MPSVYMETYQLIGIIYRYEFHALDLPVQSEEEAQAFCKIFFEIWCVTAKVLRVTC